MNDSLNSNGYPNAGRAPRQGCQSIPSVAAFGPSISACAFPRQAPFEQGSPTTIGTMHTLRLPSAHHRRFVNLHARLIPSAPVVRVPSGTAPGGFGALRRVGPLVYRSRPLRLLSWKDRRLSQVSGEPTRTFALLSDPAGRTHPCHNGRVRSLPPGRQEKLAGSRVLSGLNHTASAPAAYASRLDCSARARLASGCRAGSAGRGSAYACTRKVPLANFSCQFYTVLSTSFRAGFILARRPRTRTVLKRKSRTTTRTIGPKLTF